MNVYCKEASEILPNYISLEEELQTLSQNTLSNDFAKLIHPENCDIPKDVTFYFKNNNNGAHDETLSAHKIILMVRSPVFARMFQHDQFTEKKENRVDLEDISVDVFRNLLEFIYTGKVAFDQRTLDLMIAADKVCLFLSCWH